MNTTTNPDRPGQTRIPPPRIRVTLTPDEWAIAVSEGQLRQLMAESLSRRPDWKDGTEKSGHVLGACGEACWHKWRGIWWPVPLVDGFKKADAVDNIQVRTTRKGFFKVKPEDDPAWIVVFVEADPDDEYSYYLVGAMRAGIAQTRYPLNDPGNRGCPVHQVPREDMGSIQDLAAKLDGAKATGMKEC